MIDRSEIQGIVSDYSSKKVTVGVLGSHSAEEVGIAANALGLPVVVVCEKGRDELYTKYNKHLFPEVILLDKFSDIIEEKNQERLRELKTIFIPNRSFSTYVGYDNIENKFKVPIYGNRYILRKEERNEPQNQYWLLQESGIKIPKKFERPEDIDRLAIVKVQQKNKPIERAFFYPNSPEDYYKKAEEKIKQSIIDEEGLKKARIEEYVLGQRFNANFQSWALKDVFDDFDFVGFDDRKQTNLNGVLGLPAKDQLSIDIPIRNEEIGHQGLTMRESQKPLVYNAAEKFLRTCEKHYSPGLNGLFSLQGAVAYDPEDPKMKKLDFYVFDVSPRNPGCPCVGPTSPEIRRLNLKYSEFLDSYKLGKIETPMDLPMMEILYAADMGTLEEIVT